MNAVTNIWLLLLRNVPCSYDFSFPWLWPEHGQPYKIQEAVWFYGRK